jgi:hypothetical protein
MMATQQTRVQRTPQREQISKLIIESMTRRLTKSGAPAHTKYHDLQHRGTRKKVFINRASAKDQGDVKEPPNQTSSDYGNDNGSGRGVLCPSDFLADMPANELG